MQAPTLRSARLILSEPMIHRGMDMTHYLKWLNDPVVTRYSEQRHEKHTKDSQYRYLQSYIHNEDMYWDIKLEENPIGSMTALLDHANMVANVGILIGDVRYWGRGFACEAYDAACEYLFGERFRKIEGGTMACNEAMISVFKKLEFTQEAVIKDHFLFNGQPKDLLIYGKIRATKVLALKSDQRERRGPE